MLDLTSVDALAWVRSRPQQFFASGVVDPVYLLAYLMTDVVELGRGACTIRRDGNWWLVGSDVDWLQNDQYSVAELFDHVVPAPAHGEHSMRGEIIVRAFATNVCVVLEGALLSIAGAIPPTTVLDRATEFRRALIFSL